MNGARAARLWSGVALIVLLTLGFLMIAPSLGLGNAPATCLTTRCFCEAPRFGALLVQPANSLSSFAFVVVGLLVAFDARVRRSAFPADAAAVFGFAAIVVGVGSVFLHATLTLWGQFADVVGMYLLGGFTLTYALQRALALRRAVAIGLYLAICTALILVLAIEPEVRRWLFLVVLLASLTVEIGFARPRRPGVELRWLLLGIVANAVAFGIWVLDQRGVLCDPTSWLQGHAIWHLLGALAVWLNYFYYRSERGTT